MVSGVESMVEWYRHGDRDSWEGTSWSARRWQHVGSTKVLEFADSNREVRTAEWVKLSFWRKIYITCFLPGKLGMEAVNSLDDPCAICRARPYQGPRMEPEVADNLGNLWLPVLPGTPPCSPNQDQRCLIVKVTFVLSVWSGTPQAIVLYTTYMTKTTPDFPSTLKITHVAFLWNLSSWKKWHVP